MSWPRGVSATGLSRSRNMGWSGRATAFTLIELLVVMAIIGMLVAMTLNAIVSARESSRVLQCKNNLHQIGLAVQMAADLDSGRLPTLWKTSQAPEPWNNFSWRVDVLPFLEEEATRKALSVDAQPLSETNSRAVSTVIPVFQCPSTPGCPRKISRIGFAESEYPHLEAAASDYAAVYEVRRLEDGLPVAGAWNGEDQKLEQKKPSPVVIVPPRVDVEPGDTGPAFLEMAPAGGDPISARLRHVGRRGTWVRVRDGLSRTILVLEQAGKPDAYDGRRRPQPIDPSEGPWATAEMSTFHGVGINDGNYFDPYSFHQGVNIVMCDGSAHFLHHTTNAAVLRALMSRDGGEIVNRNDWE